MEVILVSLNAKYIHSSLALRYLRAVTEHAGFGVTLQEFNINQTVEFVTGEIYKLAYSALARKTSVVVGFSCYIWNIDMSRRVINRLKKMAPEVIVVCGGPEVSYNPEEVLSSIEADYIVAGEGEKAWLKLLESLPEKPRNSIPGLWFANGEKLVAGGVAEPPEVTEVLSPYERLDGLENRLVNYETSRGCPFNCQYCLSSVSRGVRYFPLERVKADLRRMIDAGIPTIKFVDRTFNCNKEWALTIWRYLLADPGQSKFHFEIEAGLLDLEMLEFLARVPPGLLQFEIGIQSSNPKTLKAVGRNVDLSKEEDRIKRLLASGNIEVFLDLIAGLPHEDYDSFGRSFDFVYELKPHRIQLGFLKLLHGSRLRVRADEFGIVYSNEAPYEVLRTADISAKELLKLKLIEEVLEYYYNGWRAYYSLNFLIESLSCRPFSLFERLAAYWEEQGYNYIRHSENSFFEHFLDFARTVIPTRWRKLRECLKFDWLLKRRGGRLPEWAGSCKSPEVDLNELVRAEDWINRYLPHMAGLSPRQRRKHLWLAGFEYPVVPELAGAGPENPKYLLFDYKNVDPVTGLARWYPGLSS